MSFENELPDQDSIVSRWIGSSGAPLVSICCITYNHEKYIEEALVGFLLQELGEPFEIVITDDASTDSTADIIRSYERRYPLIIKPLYQSENRYSRGESTAVVYTYPRARGEYIAFCEGDDYWCDPAKLRIQVDALRAHPDIDLSFHKCKRLYEIEGEREFSLLANYGDTKVIFTSNTVISKGGGFIPSPSIFFRRSCLVRVFNYYSQYKPLVAGDYLIQAFTAERGGALYIPVIGATYRQGIAGSWSTRFNSDSEFACAWWEKVLTQVKHMREFSSDSYNEAYSGYISRLLLGISRSARVSFRHKRSIYSRFGHELDSFRRFAFNLNCLFFNKVVASFVQRLRASSRD